MLRCLSPFAFGTHISLETLVWVHVSWKTFENGIGSIGLWPNHSGKFCWGEIGVFVEVIFNFFCGIGFVFNKHEN